MTITTFQGKQGQSSKPVGTAGRAAFRFPLRPACAALLGIFASAMLHAHAQTAEAVNDGGPQKAHGEIHSKEKLRNGFAENLKPKVKRSPTALNQPYVPIKKQDDQSQIPEIEMFVGESRVFPAPGVARIAVGNGQIMTAAALDNKEILIFANGIGTSSLFVWNEDGRYQRVKVNIVAGDTTRIAREVAAFLTTIPHAKASIVGDKVIVEGEQLSDADLLKIEMLEKRYPQIVNFTNRLGWEKMVMMDVKVVEFPKNELRELGLKWGAVGGATIGGIWRPIVRGNDGPFGINIPSGTGGLPIVNPDGSSTGIPLPSALNIRGAMNLGLSAQLNLLDQSGKASILAEPQLSARNGSKANFLAGGEFPYSVATVNGVTILFKPYGIKLEIEPKVDRNGVIRAMIDAEVSKIDSSVATTAGPALLTRRTKTEFNVHEGETIVLAGLVRRDSSNNIDKVPLLGDIPVLGALFRSKRFQNDETELVVFVTPTVIDSRSPGLVDRVERTTERLEQELGRKPYLSNPLQPSHDPARTNMPVPRVDAPASDSSDSAHGNRPAVVSQAAAVEPVMQAAAMHSATHSQVVPASQNPLMSATTGGSTLRVKTDGLVIRAEPDVRSDALLQLGYGSVVQLGASNLRSAGGTYWRNVVVGDVTGWVVADALEPSHQLPGIKPYATSRINSVDQRGAVLALGPDANGQAVPPGAVRPGSPTPSKAAENGQSKQFRVALNELAMRVTPDVNAPIVQNLSEGQIVNALPQRPHNNWTAVQVDGRSGWVATQWLNPVISQK